MTKKSNSYDVLFSLLLLLVFLLCSILTVLIRSRVHESTCANNSASSYSNMAISYITNKIRQADRASSVEVRETDGCGVLVFFSSTNGLQYGTWIYILNGVLKELYAEKDGGSVVEDGLDIMECTFLDFTSRGTTSQLTIYLETEPSDITARLSLRSESKGDIEP